MGREGVNRLMINSYQLSESVTYAEAKAIADDRNHEVDAASAALQSYPRGPMGLPPEEVRLSPAYQAARARYAAAFARLRAFNGPFVKRFTREIRADIDAKRAAKLAVTANL